MSKRYKVAVWGTGMVGAHALRYILGRPDLQLVGVKCHHANKVGLDAAELADGQHAATGVKATCEARDIVALDADAVIFVPFDPLSDPSIEGSPSSAWVPDLLALLRSGKNVITSILSMAHWRHLKNGETLRASIEQACQAGNSSLFCTGLDPGFIPDTLAYTLGGILNEVTQIDTWEILDYGSYSGLDAVRALGFGSRPEQLSADGLEMLRTCWGGCPNVLADAFGVTLDDIRVDVDISLAEQSFVTVSGLEIGQGSIDAIMFRVAGVRGGKDLFTVNHVTRIRPEAGQKFYRIGDEGGYSIHIQACPPLKADFPFGLPGGTGKGWSDAMVMTSSRLVNSIESVIEADAGWRLFFELKRLGGRFALKVD